MDSPHILLVDDDRALLQALPHMVALRIHGVQVDTSDTAQGALEQIQEHDYDAIVTDIKMPGMDGLELLAKIQELRPEIPTLLITGHADQSLIIQALRYGAYDFIEKPIDRVYFVAALHRAIQARQLRRQVQEQQHALEQHAQTLEQLVEQRTRELLVANELMDSLVRDLLDYSLIQSGEFVLHPERCNLVELCQQVLDAYTTGAGLALVFESDAAPVEVDVDRERIGQVLIHLLSHARKHSPVGTPISITLHHSHKAAIIEVRDSGIGLEHELLPHIFEPFYRAPEIEAPATMRPNISPGLYLSRYIIEQHGGSIEVQSIPGEGNIFSIMLPLATSSTEEEVNDLVSAGRVSSPFQPPRWLVS
ncbi:MAG TPA: hybrid sensor histidine kinase/response regulator [Ktedonobacteraceae bacterium]|nr:hybrid sensor histidine kinase/response regulator [Ktedonobacteraceae bacterium]